MAKDGSFAGILSERDVVNVITKFGAAALEQLAADIMTKNVITCLPDDSLSKIMKCMTERRIRHLPCVDDEGQLHGILSIGDAVKARMDELEIETAAMHDYIKDRRWRELSLQVGRGGAAAEFESLGDAMLDKS